MSKLCPVAVASDPTVTVEQQPDSVLDSHLLLLKRKRLCDVVFTFENSTKQLEAHQLYLRERSPVFDLIFRTSKPSANGGKRVIDVTGATLSTFWEFLKFIYADKFQTTIAGALDLLYLARKYKVDPLTKKCEALIKTQVTPDGALEVFEAAYRYGKQDLMEKAGNLLAKNVEALWPKLLGAQEFTLNYLFRRDDLKVRECDVFKFLLSWGKNRPGGETDLKGILTSLIPVVRFTCMTPYEFTTVVVPTGLLSAEEIVQVYSYFGSDPAMRSEIGTNLNFSVAPREAQVVDKCIPFYSRPTKSWSHTGKTPLKECTSFMAKIGPHPSTKVWCEFSAKRPSIKGILIRWPSRAVEYSDIKDENLNFSVALNWCIGPIQDKKNIEVKFSRVLAQRASGQSEEIKVEPPVELTNGIKYCITVEDLSAHADKRTISSAAENNPPASVRFTYCAPNKVKWIRNSSFNMENWPIELLDVEQNRKLTGFGNYGDLQLVVGVLIGLV